MTTNRGIEATSVECPYCGVAAGQPCVTRTGNVAAKSHAARIRESGRAEQLRTDVTALLPNRWDVLALDTAGEEHVAVLVCRDGRDAATILHDNGGYAVEGVMAETYDMADHWRAATVHEAVAHVLSAMREERSA